MFDFASISKRPKSKSLPTSVHHVHLEVLLLLLLLLGSPHLSNLQYYKEKGNP